MFRYKFTDVDLQRARTQAEAHGKHCIPRIKGNLGEIAFHRFCRNFIPLDHWRWLNGEAIRRGISEYNDYDFEVFDEKLDVKVRSNLVEFTPGVLLDDRRGSIDEDDILVMVWLDGKEEIKKVDEAVIIGWSRVKQIEYVYTNGDYRFDGTAGTFEYLPTRPLMELIQLNPGLSQDRDRTIAEFELGECVVDTKTGDEAIVVEMTDELADRYEFRDDRTVADAHPAYDPKSPVIGIIYTSTLTKESVESSIIDVITTYEDDIYYFPQERFESNESG